MADVTLYHWEPNANSGKPMLALAEKGVPFSSHYIDMLQFDQYLGLGTPPLRIVKGGKVPAFNPGNGDMIGWAG